MFNKEPLELLDEYQRAFRDSINVLIQGRKRHPSKLLHLSSQSNWGTLCVAMDVLGDTTYAIRNFLRFGMDGPTRYEDTGEKYLRLYGLLSATYLQQDAALKIHALLARTDLQTRKRTINSLSVRKIRNKVAAHSVEYREHRGAPAGAFVPIRFNLAGFSCSISAERGDWSETIDLKKALAEHCTLLVEMLDVAVEQVVALIPVRRRKGSAHKLEDLRFQREGGIVVPGPPGRRPVRIKISTASARKGKD